MTTHTEVKQILVLILRLPAGVFSQTNKDKALMKRRLSLGQESLICCFCQKCLAPFWEPSGSFSSFCASSILSGRQEERERALEGAGGGEAK